MLVKPQSLLQIGAFENEEESDNEGYVECELESLMVGQKVKVLWNDDIHYYGIVEKINNRGRVFVRYSEDNSLEALDPETQTWVGVLVED